MAKLEINVSNYRLLKDLKVVFETGNIYLVKAGNRKGKTSFTMLINDMFEAKASTDNTVTFGEEHGEAKMKIINFKNEEGNNYTLKYEYGKEDKFSLILPDGSVKKKVTDIRDIFKYQKMSVDKFFALGLTADGRKKQAEFIRNIIPASINNRITEIDSLINERNGTVFLERKKLNDEITIHQSILSEKQLTDKEKEALKIKDDYITKTEELKKQFNLLHDEKIKAENDSTDEKIKSIKEVIKVHQENIKSNNAEIIDLEAKLKRLREDNVLYEEKVTENEKALKSLENNEKEPFDILAYNTLKDKVALREENIEKLKTLEGKYTELINAQNKIADVIENKEKKTKELEDLRSEKKNLIANAKLPEKLSIIENELMFDNGDGNYLPLNEDNVSYATGGKEIVKLIAEVNKDLPIILIGKAAEYDEQSFEELEAIAKEYDMAIVCDYVESNSDLEIVCYQKNEL